MHASYEATRRPNPPPTQPGPPFRLKLNWTHNLVGLVVDDEPSANTTFVRMLSSVVDEVLTAQTAAAARDLALTRQPHIVLADVRLRTGDGLDLVAEIRSHGVLARVIVVSGFLDDAIEDRAAALGALAVLPKPVSLEALAAAVDGALRPLGPLGDSWVSGFEGTAAERWVSIVLRVLKSPQDPYVREELTRRGAVSPNDTQEDLRARRDRTARHTRLYSHAVSASLVTSSPHTFGSLGARQRTNTRTTCRAVRNPRSHGDSDGERIPRPSTVCRPR